MSLKSRIFNILNKINGKATVSDTCKQTPERISNESAAPVNVTPRIKRRQMSPPPPPPERIVLDMARIMRWRHMNPPWSYRKIARELGNVGYITVRKNVLAYEAAERAPANAEALKPIPAAPKPAPPPVAPVAPVATPAIARPSAPSPIANFGALAAVWKARGLDRFPPDLSHIFIVRPEHLKFGLGSEQPCIGFDAWRAEYRTLEMFQPPSKFWVLVNAEDGAAVNRPWLDSIASDIWMRERCLVYRIACGGVLTVFQGRFAAQRQYPKQAYGSRLADQTFETQIGFAPMPQPNHHELLGALMKDAVPREPPQAVSNYEYGTGWTSPQPMPPQASIWDDGQSRRSEGAGGLCIGGEDDNWK